MSERPTPETDTETMRDEYDHVDTDFGPFAPSDTVPADFARCLKRERDEAREAAAKWESSFDAMERAGAEQARRADENREWALRAERERDEAREEWGKASMDAAKLLSEKTKVMSERDEARESLENARELNKWLTVFLEHIRDNADIRYGKHRGLLAFSDLREEASRKWKEVAK